MHSAEKDCLYIILEGAWYAYSEAFWFALIGWVEKACFRGLYFAGSAFFEMGVV